MTQTDIPVRFAPAPYRPVVTRTGHPQPVVPRTAHPQPDKPKIVWIAVAFVATLLMLVATAGTYILWLAPVTYTSSGKDVVNAEGVLEDAKKQLDTLVKVRHGAVDDDTRCYLGTARQPSARDRVEVDRQAWCGVTYLPDSDKGAYWMAVPLTEEPADGGVRLTAGIIDQDATTQELPAHTALVGPDRDGAPDDDGGLKIPPPPPAAADLVQVSSVDDAKAQGIDVDANLDAPVVMKGWDSGVSVVGRGTPARIGAGQDVRRPADGHEFLALRVKRVSGESVDAVRESLATGNYETAGTTYKISAGETVHNIGTKIDDTREVVAVVSVPKGSDAQLELTEDGLEQSVSMRTAKPSTQNPTVLSREHTSVYLDKTGSTTGRVSDGGRSAGVDVRYTVKSARLAYYRGFDRDGHAAKDKAYLVIIASAEMKNENASSDGAIPAGLLSVRADDGKTYKAKDYNAGGKYAWNAVEVPADFTSGDIVLGGTDSAGGIDLTISSEKTIPVTFP